MSSTFSTCPAHEFAPAALGGLDRIVGVQARYFCRFDPFLFLPPWAGRVMAKLPGVAQLPRPAALWLSLPAILMAAVNACALPAHIFHIFRMRGP